MMAVDTSSLYDSDLSIAIYRNKITIYTHSRPFEKRLRYV